MSARSAGACATGPGSDSATQAGLAPAARRRGRRGLVRIEVACHLAAAVLLLGIFLLAGRLFTLHNGFSYQLHTDEYKKAEQIISGEYNFRHPQLLLRGAQAMLLVRTGTTDGVLGAESRDRVEVPLYNRILLHARYASAAFAAGAVVLLALTAYWQRSSAGMAGLAHAEPLPGLDPGPEQPGRDYVRGLAALVAVGAALMACSLLLVNAHFAKEEASLVLGIAAWVAAGAWYVRRPSLWRVLLFAGACGLVICGKWIGAALAVVGLILIGLIGFKPRRQAGVGGELPWPSKVPDAAKRALLAGRRGGRAAGMGLALLAMLGVLLMVNLPILWQFEQLVAGIRHEATHLTTDHSGLVGATLSFYPSLLLRELGWPLALLALFEVAATAVLPGRRPAAGPLAGAAGGGAVPGADLHGEHRGRPLPAAGDRSGDVSGGAGSADPGRAGGRGPP